MCVYVWICMCVYIYIYIYIYTFFGNYIYFKYFWILLQRNKKIYYSCLFSLIFLALSPSFDWFPFLINISFFSIWQVSLLRKKIFEMLIFHFFLCNLCMQIVQIVIFTISYNYMSPIWNYLYYSCKKFQVLRYHFFEKLLLISQSSHHSCRNLTFGCLSMNRLIKILAPWTTTSWSESASSRSVILKSTTS